MKKSFLTVCFVVLVFGLMFSLSSCQKKQEADTGAQPGVESTDTAAPAPEAAPAEPEMTPAPEAPATDTAAPAPEATEVPAPPAAQ